MEFYNRERSFIIYFILFFLFFFIPFVIYKRKEKTLKEQPNQKCCLLCQRSPVWHYNENNFPTKNPVWQTVSTYVDTLTYHSEPPAMRESQYVIVRQQTRNTFSCYFWLLCYLMAQPNDYYSLSLSLSNNKSLLVFSYFEIVKSSSQLPSITLEITWVPLGRCGPGYKCFDLLTWRERMMKSQLIS